MKISVIAEDLLNELSPAQIYDKYYQTSFSENEFKRLVRYDPKTVIENGELVKVGKYAKLILNLVKNNKIKSEDLPKIHEYLTYVYKYNISLDIKKISELSDIYNLVGKYIASESESLSTVLKSLSSSDYKTLFNGKNWIIFQPLTEKGACYLGVSTQWCTTWGPYSLNKNYRDRSNLYNHYNKQGPLYIVINKNDENNKYQFHFQTNQYMGKNDNPINVNNFFEENKEVMFFFFPTLVKETTIETKKIEIKRASTLPAIYANKMLDIYLNSIGTDNKLVIALSQTDDETVNELISDDVIEEYIDVNPYIVQIELKESGFEQSDELDGLRNTINHIDSQLANIVDFLYDDINDEYINDYRNDLFRSFLEKYYEDNRDYISNSFGFTEKNKFIETMLPEMLEDDKFFDNFIDTYVSLSVVPIESELKNELLKYDRTIKLDYSTTIINKPAFMVYLLKKNISSIDENLVDVLSDFITSSDVMIEEELVYDLLYRERIIPKYNDMKEHIDKFVEEQEDIYHSNEKWVKDNEKLSELIRTTFKGKQTIENDIVKLSILLPKVDVETGKVPIKYLDKKTGETHEGLVSVDSIPDYVYNYKLYESFIRYTELIKGD